LTHPARSRLRHAAEPAGVEQLPRTRWARLPDLAELDQFQAKRFNLRDDAEHRGPILEPAGEYGLLAVDVMDHRRKGRERGRPEAPIDPDAIQVVLSVHGPMVRGVR
jgi:hypothetical protein